MDQRIKMIRKSQNLTQAEFGERIGIKGNTVTGYETGLRVPSDAIIISICREFNINEGWLRTGDGEMFRPTRRNDEITAFFGDILSSDPDFRHRFVSVLARMTPGEWAILESKIKEIAGEMKKDGQ